MKKYTFIIIVLLFNIPAFTQQNISSNTGKSASDLPDISVIGDFISKWSTDADDSMKNRIYIRGVELCLQGYIYPEMRADIFLAMHRHGDSLEPELCEGYVSFLNLLDAFTIQAGKIHVNFGKINQVHEHHRPYVDLPQVITNFFGDHGLVGEGGTLSALLPMPFFAQLDLSIWRVAGHTHSESEEGEEEDTEFGFGNEVYTGRLWTSFGLSDISELEIGTSGAMGNGSHYQHHQDEAIVAGFDLTYKLWPSSYERLIFQNELLYLFRKVPVGELKRYGFYNYFGYKFDKYWNAGLRYDWAENALPDKQLATYLSSIITNDLTETTHLRLQYKYGFENKVSEVYLHLTFGIGPHSHPLE